MPEVHVSAAMQKFLMELRDLFAAHQTCVTAPIGATLLVHCEGVRYTVTIPSANTFEITEALAAPRPFACESLELVCRTKNWPVLRAACQSVLEKHAMDRRFVTFVAQGHLLCERDEWVVPVNIPDYGDLLAAMTLRGLEFVVRAKTGAVWAKAAEPSAP